MFLIIQRVKALHIYILKNKHKRNNPPKSY